MSGAKTFVLTAFTYLVLSLALMVNLSHAAEQDSQLDIQPYGYFKLDTAFDQARTNNGNYVFWVDDAASKNKDSEFNMTARQTRLGAKINYEGNERVIVSGQFEVDFYGGGAENKNTMMMRHGFMKADFGKYYVLAGQTSDIFSPLVPTTVNYTALWNCGNIGYRHPQLQIGTVLKNGIQIVGALSRNTPGDLDNDGNEDGEDNPLPTVQGRLSYLNSTLNVGLSGHYGKMEFTNSTGAKDSYSSYSLNLHCSYAFTDDIGLKGELFTGKTLNQYLGGIGQGFDYQLEKEIETSGGWINATYKATSKISLNLGTGIDQPNNSSAACCPPRNFNSCVFANVFSKIAYNTFFAVEVSNWTTGYYDSAGNNTATSNLRSHAAFIFNIN